MTKPRKGLRFLPEISTLLRDAEPTWNEIRGEPDARKRRAAKRRRDIAIDELVTLFREYNEQKRLNAVDPRVLLFCNELKKQNGHQLPKRRGGRPVDMHRRLLIAVSVIDAVEQRGDLRNKVEPALAEVAAKFNVTSRTVRDIYYDRDPDWMFELNAEMSRRRFEFGLD